MAQHFLEQVCEESGKTVRGFTDEAMAALQRYRWPGNVRELQNVIERAVLLGKSDMIRLEDLPPSADRRRPGPRRAGGQRTLKQALEAPSGRSSSRCWNPTAGTGSSRPRPWASTAPRCTRR